MSKAIIRELEAKLEKQGEQYNSLCEQRAVLEKEAKRLKHNTDMMRDNFIDLNNQHERLKVKAQSDIHSLENDIMDLEDSLRGSCVNAKYYRDAYTNHIRGNR